MSIKALQQTLKDARLYAGRVDGSVGPLTLHGLDQYRQTGKIWWPLQRDVPAVFGEAGSAAATAGKCALPFAFHLAWNASSRVIQFSCHRDVARPLEKIFADAARHYGEARFRALGLDLFGGCFNDRAMRGGRAKSMHAYGIAVDLDPARNQLRWKRDRASFAGADYVPFWNIVEASGAVSLGRVADYDWMHFQFARR